MADQELNDLKCIFHPEAYYDPPSAFERITHKVRNYVVRFISLKAIKRQTVGCVFSFVMICLALSATLWILLLLYEYSVQTDVTFISLSSNAGDCSFVTRSFSETLLASVQGLWEGDADFQYNSAVFKVKFNSISATPDEFLSIMTDDFNISYIKDFVQDHNLAQNIAFIMSYRQRIINGGNVQELSTISYPYIVLNGRNKEAYVYNGLNPDYCEVDDVRF
mmetsp:Transcript_31778/g.53603  ORF Transcript_31778/g.53603 Transcript_31778/m.53603 type:complete len:221 (+) Transcript_31778:87-749(+)